MHFCPGTPLRLRARIVLAFTTCHWIDEPNWRHYRCRYCLTALGGGMLQKRDEPAAAVRRVPGLLPALAMLALLVVGLAGKSVAEDAVSLDAVLAKLAPPPSGEALTQIPEPRSEERR